MCRQFPENGMFSAMYPSLQRIKYIVDSVSKIADEFPFLAKTDMLVSTILTPDKVAMIRVELPSTAFDTYECDKDEAFMVSIDDFKKVLRRGQKNDAIGFTLEREHHRLKLVFRDRKSGAIRIFYVPLKEGPVEIINEPKVELPVTVKMAASDLKEIIRDVKIVGEEVEFICENGERLIIQSITQQKKYKVVLESERPLFLLSGPTEVVSAKYSREMIEYALKFCMAADNVTIEFGTNLPMRMTFELPGGGVVKYWIAPRVG